MRSLPDIAYTQALIDGGTRRITLCYDAYLPDAGAPPGPAIILAFGGAFHRGSKEDDAFPGAGDTGSNTAMAEYCPAASPPRASPAFPSATASHPTIRCLTTRRC